MGRPRAARWRARCDGASVARCGAPARAPVPKRLQSFVGTWETEGQQYESPLGPAAKVKALETYGWLTGRAFLVHRFEGHVGDKPAARLELIGAAEAGTSFPVHTFYDNGFVGEWQLQERGPSWILHGHWPVR